MGPIKIARLLVGSVIEALGLRLIRTRRAICKACGKRLVKAGDKVAGSRAICVLAEEKELARTREKARRNAPD